MHRAGPEPDTTDTADARDLSRGPANWKIQPDWCEHFWCGRQAKLVAEDILVGNAGTGVSGPIGSITQADVDRIWAVNVHGLVTVTERTPTNA